MVFLDSNKLARSVNYHLCHEPIGERESLDVVAPLGQSFLIFLSLSIQPSTPMTFVPRGQYHHSHVYSKHNNKEEKEKVAIEEEQSRGLPFEMQNHVPPNLIIPTSIVVTCPPPNDIEVEYQSYKAMCILMSLI